MRTPSLIWRWKSSVFLHVLEVSRGSRHLLETIHGSFVHLTTSKVSFLPFSRELFSHVALLLLGTWDDHVTFLPYPLAPKAFLQVYMLGPVCSPWPNCFLGLRHRWELFHSPQNQILFLLKKIKNNYKPMSLRHTLTLPKKIILKIPINFQRGSIKISKLPSH